MSELINKPDVVKNLRWQLLATASAIVLCAAVSPARADDNDRPTVWVELGGQLSHLKDGQEIFDPSVFDHRPSMFAPSKNYEGFPPNSIDETGKISFEPNGSSWVFSAAVRYGRSSAMREKHQQTNPGVFVTYISFGGYRNRYAFAPLAAKFADTSVSIDESHLVLDFQVGKDVGLGMFGNDDGSSVFSLGVRFAQFQSKSNIALKSDPDWHRSYKYGSYPSFGIQRFKWVSGEAYHSNQASIRTTRNFHGIGPSISWNASKPLAGNQRDGELSLDWGLNAAMLFGRQRARVEHQTTARYHPKSLYGGAISKATILSHFATAHTRSRSVTVPNIGAFAGATYRIENFKVSAGYKADFFIGANDSGIDMRDAKTIGFYGPFATISVGLGG